MVFKINISEKTGKTFKIESEAEELIGKSLHDKVNGTEISPELNGYEFEIAGASDIAGFPSLEIIEGVGLKKVLLSFEKGMKKRPRKEGKRKRTDYKPSGLKLRKTARGKVISPSIVQINLKTIKEGNKKLSEIFPEQNKPKETKAEQPAEAPAQ
jgi:ribosomal protein S6E (S10)